MKRYFDSSAIVKRYLPETGTAWVISTVRGTPRDDLYLSQITGVEVVAAFARKRRNKEITHAVYTKAIRAFERHFRHRYSRLDVTLDVIKKAIKLAKTYPLRGHDAVQLASALILKDTLKKAGITDIIFVSADNVLCNVALAENLTVDNPNNYP